MKSSVIFTICLAIVLLIACNSNDKKKVPPQPTVTNTEDTNAIETVDSGLDVEMIDTFNTTAFSNYVKKQSSGFDWSRFRLTNSWTDDSMMTASWAPDKKFYDMYGRFVRYSPDSTKFIDLDSYNIHIEKDSKGNLTGTESGPDTEVSLVDLKSNKKIRLLFMGPGGSVEDALWLDKDNLALMGVQDYGDSTGKVAAVWKLNIPTNTFYLYELNDGGAAQKIMRRWRKERLKGIVVR